MYLKTIEEINKFLEEFDFSEDTLNEKLSAIDSKQMDIFREQLWNMSPKARENSVELNRKRYVRTIDNIIDAMKKAYE